MTPRNLIVAAIAACIVSAALLLGMQLGARSTVPAVADEDPQPTSEASVSPVRNPVQRPLPLARPSPGPLPPVDTPLADAFEELMERADRGDDRAACRLALEVQACERARRRTPLSLSSMEYPAQQDTSGMDADELERLEATIESAERRLEEARVMQARCEGVPEVPFGRHWTWLRQAAQAGRPAAVQEYIGGEGFPFNLWMREPEHLERYRRDLAPMAWRAMEAGDVEIAWRLMNAYIPQDEMMRFEPLAQMVDPDPVMAMALGLFVQDVSNRADGDQRSVGILRTLTEAALRGINDQLDPAQIQEAQSRSREWVRSIEPQTVDSTPYSRHGIGYEDHQRRREALYASCEAE